MNQIKTTTGTVRLVRNGVVMVEKKYSYHSSYLKKEDIIERWKHVYGKLFWKCELQIVDKKLGQIKIDENVQI